MAIQRSSANGVGVIGAKSAAHGRRHGALWTCEPPDIVPPPSVIDDAIVLLQIRGLFWCRAALEIIRRRDKECGRGADPTGDQRGIVHLANTNLKIDSLFDEIAQPVVQDEVDRQFVMLLQQRIEFAAEVKPERNRNAQADASAESTSCFAAGTRSRPSSVSVTACVLRWTRRVPKCSSSALTCREIAGCVTLRSSATADLGDTKEGAERCNQIHNSYPRYQTL
jgi:hypothetical protein